MHIQLFKATCTINYNLSHKQNELSAHWSKSFFSVFCRFTEMLAEIENRLFVGGPDKKGKNPMYCLNSLESRVFRCAVEFIVVSLAYKS